jgi:integrase
MHLQAITPTHVRQLYLQMQMENRGEGTIQLVHVTLHWAFSQAVKEGLLGYNPVEAVKRPKVETKRYDIHTEEQACTFMVSAKGHAQEALFFLALITSIGQGEIMGLIWTDLDSEKSIIRVERQLKLVSYEGGALVLTKTRSGRRAIMVGPSALALLKEYREKQELQKALAGSGWQEHGMIFTTFIGTYIDQTKVSRAFKQILWQASLPDIRFHDLRHTSISILLDNGTPVNTAQSRESHSKASVTTNIYGHVMSHSQDAAAENIELIVKPLTIVSQ